MNVGLVMFPFLLCLLMFMIQLVVNSQLDKPKYRCGCKCVQNGNGTCQNRCGVEFSATQQAAFACPIRTPHKWPALFQIPGPRHRAVQTAAHSFAGLPHASCLKTGSCPVTSLYTGQNRSSAQGIYLIYHFRHHHHHHQILVPPMLLSYFSTISYKIRKC